MEHFWWKLIYDGNIVLPLPIGRGGGSRIVEFSFKACNYIVARNL